MSLRISHVFIISCISCWSCLSFQKSSRPKPVTDMTSFPPWPLLSSQHISLPLDIVKSSNACRYIVWRKETKSGVCANLCWDLPAWKFVVIKSCHYSDCYSKPWKIIKAYRFVLLWPESKEVSACAGRSMHVTAYFAVNHFFMWCPCEHHVSNTNPCFVLFWNRSARLVTFPALGSLTRIIARLEKGNWIMLAGLVD